MKFYAEKAENPFYNCHPSGVPVISYHAYALQRMNRIDEALQNYKKAYKLHPYNYQILSNMGKCYGVRDDFKNAEKKYSELLKIWPESRQARFGLAKSYYEQENYESAFILFDYLDPKRENESLKTYFEKIDSFMQK